MATERDIKYLGRDFDSFRNELVEFTKTYFPTTYTDFTPSSPGMMFMEMSAYVGDVLSFYLDNQIQETFIQNARQTENLYSLAYLLGYKPKVTSTSVVDIDIYQMVPAISKGGNMVPDYNYALQIQENTVVTSTSNIPFIIEDKIDFTTSSSIDPTEVNIYEVTGAPPTPASFLLKKTTKAIQSQISLPDNSIVWNLLGDEKENCFDNICD